MGTDGRNGFRVLIAGGGVAALEAALALRALADDRVSVELLAPEDEFVFRPLAVAEPFRVGEARRLPLGVLAEEAGAALRRGALAAVDADERRVVTDAGEALPYDALLLAVGARATEAVRGALTFGGPDDGPALASLLEEALAGGGRRIVFAVPAGASWPLPLYELALLTWSYLTDRGVVELDLTVVTPEEAPLALFGATASEGVAAILDLRRIGVRVRTTPLAFDGRTLQTAPAGGIAADRVVSLPRLEAPAIPGVPRNADGFVPVDGLGAVRGLERVFAAGDVTSFPLKQGGLAAAQADAAATAIARLAGASATAEPFRPVLQGQLLTGIFPRYLRAEVGTSESTIGTEPLWWPPTKIAGRHLSGFLAERLGVSTKPPPDAGAIPVEIALDASRPGVLT